MNDSNNNNLIPLKIHYCWFGGNPLPDEAKRCISSWKKYMPDYEIIEWNESNFDIKFCKYTKQAYEAKKWAFVSDVARFYVLYNYGGVYLDTDVEIIRSLTPIIEKGAFMGVENKLEPYDSSKKNTDYILNRSVNPGLGLAAAPGLGLAAAPGLGLYNEILNYYKKADFIDCNGKMNTKTVVRITSEILKQHGFVNTNDIQKVEQITIYPKEYFCPLDYETGKLEITENTYSIHWYSASWLSSYSKFKLKLKRLLGKRISRLLGKIENQIIKRN